MYLPAHFKMDHPDELLAFMDAHGFATLVTAPEGVPFATHLPVVVQREGEDLLLCFHLARANPQWRHFSAGEVLVIFQGPHALIHPAWYDSSPNVPTWNYAAVHAYGLPRVMEGDAPRQIASLLVQKYAPDMAAIPEDYERRQLGAVVTVEVRVTRLEGKYKLSQNKTAQDRRNVAEHLASSGRSEERATAELMRRHVLGEGT